MISLLRPFDMTAEIIARSYIRSCMERISRDWEPLQPQTPLGLIGGGLMGTAIAATHLGAQRAVVLCDLHEEVLAHAPEKIIVELRLQHPEAPLDRVHEVVRNNLFLTREIEPLLQCETIIESIPEKLKIKQKLYRNLEKAGFRGFLFSNTSTLEISKLSETLENPARFCGFHFFHPVRSRSLLEIVRGVHSDENTISTARKHAFSIGKTPILVNDAPGFLVNRILNPLLREALVLLEQGVPIELIEESAQIFGMPMGPFRIMDEIGLDVALHAGWVLAKAFPQRAYNSPILLKLIEARRWGRKSGRGFMQYSSEVSWDSPGLWDPTLELFLPNPQKGCVPSERTHEEIVRRLFLPMLCEAVRCVEEGVVAQYWEADLAVVLGLGFPSSRGGLCFWADSIGLEPIVAMLENLEKKEGARFEIPQTLRRFAEQEQSFTRANIPKKGENH